MPPEKESNFPPIVTLAALRSSATTVPKAKSVVVMVAKVTIGGTLDLLTYQLCQRYLSHTLSNIMYVLSIVNLIC